MIAIDTSGSTTGDIVKTFVSEVQAILNSFGGYELRLIQCDMRIHEDTTYDLQNPFLPDNFKLKGGGGTDFIPVFKLISQDTQEPEVLLFLTDGFGLFPSSQTFSKLSSDMGRYRRGCTTCSMGRSIPLNIGNK